MATKKKLTKKARKSRSVTRLTKASPKASRKVPKARKLKTRKRRQLIPGPPIAPPTDSVGVGPVPVAGVILAWEDDPDSVPARPPLQLPIPSLPTGTLGITIVEPAPPAELHPPGTSRFRYWSAAEALSRGMQFWQRFLPPGTRWATPTGKLVVHLDLGVDLNAYYRRGANRLEFYHSTVGGKTIYTGESASVVCHELGHAVLDAIRPQLFHAASVEAAAFHESFGDMSAILCALQLNSVAQSILEETGGRLYRTTFLSRMAEQLGWAIRQINAQAVEPDCLRNAVNSFFYRDPATVPTSAPASALSSAPHSFSRVFTAAFFDSFAGMLITDNPTPTVASLQKVTRDMGRLLVDAIKNAPVVPNYFSQVAAQIIAADEARFSRKYRDILKGAFVRHGILSLEGATAIVGRPVPVSTAMNVAGIAGGSSKPSAATGDLVPVAMPTATFGLTVPTILCAAPDEGGGYAGAAAAALDTGSISPPSHTDAVRSFLEDLFRLGRIDIANHGDPDAKIANPTVRKTHTLKTTPAGPMLVRETFDCGFDAL
jgi:hypothetical protein